MMSVNFFYKISNLPCGDSFPVECDDGCFQFIGSSSVVWNQLLFKMAVYIAWYLDMKFAIRCIEITLVETVSAVSSVVTEHTALLIPEELC